MRVLRHLCAFLRSNEANGNAKCPSCGQSHKIVRFSVYGREQRKTCIESMNAMTRLILAVLLLFTAPQHLHAETPDCLPHPTQDCVFQMALHQADEQDWAWLIAEGYLAVAYLQELEQTDQEAETLAALLVKLSLADPDPMAMRRAIRAGWSGLMLGGTPIDESSALTEWFVITMADLNRQVGLPVEAPPDFMPPERCTQFGPRSPLSRQTSCRDMRG